MVATMHETNEPLLPCPFCGSTILHIESDNHQGSTFQVLCDNPECEAEGPNVGLTKQEAVSLWNKRF